MFQASKLAYFEETNAKPIEDHSLLPAVLKDPCKDVPLSWHEKVLIQESKSTRSRQYYLYYHCFRFTHEHCNTYNRFQDDELALIMGLITITNLVCK